MSTLINGQAGVASRYQLRRCKADGTVVQESGWSPNIITQSGLDFMCDLARGHTNPRVKLAVGTSNAAPAISDTALGGQIASTTTVVGSTVKEVQSSVAPYYTKTTATFRFGAGEAAGNIQEVGAFSYYDSVTLISRALVVDGSGNPTTISPQADEYLDVVWEFYFVMSPSSGTFNMDIDGVSTAFGYSLSAIGMDSAWGPPIDASVIKLKPGTHSSADLSFGVRDATALASPTAVLPTGGTMNGRFETSQSSAYVVGSSEIAFTYVMPLENGDHANGFNAIVFEVASQTQVQMLLDQAVMKTASKVFDITLTLSLANAAIPAS